MATKLRSPRPAFPVLPRPRVDAVLRAAVRRPLTVVTAPVGSGRTTALATWTAAAGVPCAWLALDEADDDPRRLWTHLLAAVEAVRPGATAPASRALWLDDDLERHVLPLTVEALGGRDDGGGRAGVVGADGRGGHVRRDDVDRRDGHDRSDDGGGGRPAAPDHEAPADRGPSLVLVLDDVHRLRAPAAWRLLRALVDAAPPGVAVVASGRTAPPLRGARRRTAGLLSVVGADELAFTREETAELLTGVRGLRLRPEWVDVVHERTAGWPAGLAHVADATPRDPGPTGFAEALAEAAAATATLVAEEVLATLPEAVASFAVRASVLERPTADRCAAVLEDPEAAALLGCARDAGLVTGRPGEERWRPPMGEALRRLLSTTRPALEPVLHERAARASLAAGRVGDAIAHAASAGDPSLVAELSEAHVAALGSAPGGARAATTGADAGVAWPWAGDVDGAVAAGWAALAADRAPSTAVRATTAAALGQALWLAGDAAEALATLEPRVGTMDHPAPRAWALATMALAAGAEDPARACRLARHARRIAARADAGWLERVLTEQAVADASRRRGEHADARAALGRAAALTAPAGGLHHAVTLTLSAELDAEVGDRRGAAEAVRDARETLDLHPDAAVLTERLAALAPALDRRHDELHGTTPTPAERRLLALLPSELSRREMGAELFVSVDTVKTHLRRLYRRLGVETRADAVTVARDRGLLPR